MVKRPATAYLGNALHIVVLIVMAPLVLLGMAAGLMAIINSFASGAPVAALIAIAGLAATWIIGILVYWQSSRDRLHRLAATSLAAAGPALVVVFLTGVNSVV